jgi:multiple sugar transport system substrate-binding protein
LLCACSDAVEGNAVSFWAMGKEGEAVKALLPEFERYYPGIRVSVQQIPWNAAHEKLLTAYAGDSMPDVFQLGNTWIPEFVALHAIDPVAMLADRSDYFDGILATYVMDGVMYAVPWYVDTRVLFYRKDLLADAGWSKPPMTWQGWIAAMEALKRRSNSVRFGMMLPLNQWQLLVILGLQNGSKLLRDEAQFGDFQSEPYRRAFSLYVGFFRKGLASVSEAQAANLYQEFAKGTFAVFLSGPWDLSELRRRLSASLQTRWATTPLPSVDGREVGVSLAGGGGLAISSTSRNKRAASCLIAFLSKPGIQQKFFTLTGDLPSRRIAWQGSEISNDANLQTFYRQLEYLAEVPKIPEWERIAERVAKYAERTIRGNGDEGQALEALDDDVASILSKRRWVINKAH